MDERSIKEKIGSAMAEPRAPDALVQKTIERAKAIQAGHRAEESLRAAGDTLSGEQRRKLAAESIVGRLMLLSAPPRGATAEQMTRQLMEQPVFQRLSDKPAEQLLLDLSSGRLLRKLGAEKETAAPAQETDAERIPRRRSGPGL